MKQNLTFEDLEGALMLISFDTVDEDGIVERETLAYTYADGKLKFYTFVSMRHSTLTTTR